MKMLLDSQWVDREKKIPVRDPYDDSIIDHVPSASAEDAELALDAAVRGFEVARNLKGDDLTKDIPIIMLTSVNQEHGFSLTVGADSVWNPVDAFIEKPFGPEALKNKIEEMI